jgi:hypothetical protein
MKLLMHYLIVIAMLLSFSIYSCKPVKKELSVGNPAFITATSLNCRKEASSFGAIVGSFLQGDMVVVREKGIKKDTIDGRENFWYLVEKDATKGWVFGGYLSPVLYEQKDLLGNYYEKYGENVQRDNVIGNVILHLESDTYRMTSFSARIEYEKAIEESGTVEFLDNMIVLRPQARKTRPNLLESGSPYGDPYRNSYQNSYQGGQGAGSAQEQRYSKGESESNKRMLYVRKLGDKFYLLYSPTISSTQITKANRYMEKN